VKRAVVTAVLAVSLAASSAWASVTTTALHARLLPVGPATSANGAFDGRLTTQATGEHLRWRLTFAHLTGLAKSGTLSIGKNGLVLTLCAPCRAGQIGELVLTRLAGRALLTRGVVVVTTRTHTKGELRGSIQTR
jgi:hypothetical protein